jgi:hypothetical protein
VTTDTAQSIVFIDSRVPDIQDLLDGLQPGEQAFVIDSSSDGIQQIADILAENNFTDLSSIAIVSHGDSGELELGSTFITDGNLSKHSNALAEIGASLAPGGAIQLYGCDVALGAGGQQFINDFSTLAGGVAVDAATHIVGSAALGGSWTLDASSSHGANGTPVAASLTQAGTTANGTPFTPAALANFQGDLVASPQTEIWIAVTGGGTDDEIVHVDDLGSGTGANAVTLFMPTSTNNPSSLSQLSDIAFDTQDNLYFLVEDQTGDGSNTPGNNPNVIWKGTLAPELTNPTATPTLTSIYSNGGGVTVVGEIEGIAVDPATQQVYFTQQHNFLKVGYGGGSTTVLSTVDTNTFLHGLALDLPDNKAFFFSENSVSTSGGAVSEVSHLWVDSNLSANTPATELPFSPHDASGPNNFPGSLGEIAGIAFDTASEVLYFTTDPFETSPGTFTNGGIFSYNVNSNTSGTFTTLWLESSVNPTIALTFIKVDHATGKYYVSDVGEADVNPAVYEGSLTVPGTPTLFTTITPGNFALAPDGLAIDNAPTLTISALSPTWTEEGASVALISSATASDTDNTALFGATVSISGGFFAGDTLTFSTAGTSLTGSYNSSTGVLTFSGTDSFTHYQTALATVEYHGGENPDDFRSDTSRTLTWSVNDGLITSAPQTSSVSVLFVNDPPTLSNFTASPQFTEEHAAAALSGALSVSDPDDLNLKDATVKITGGSFAGDTDVLAANTSGTSITATYDSTTQTLTLSGTDTLADYQSVLDSVTFSSGENPNNFGSNTTRTITWVAQDPSGTLRGGIDTSSTSTTTLTVNNVNDPPTLALGTTTAAWTEEAGTPTTLSPSLSITDVDSFGLVSATVSITGGAFTGDQLFVSGQTSGSPIPGTNITPTFAGNGLVIFNGSDTLADYQSALELVTFNGGENPTDFGSDPTRTITWTLNDGGGTANGGVQASSVTSTVSVTFINDPPSLSNVNTGAQYTEEQVGGTTLSSALSVSDPDDVNLKSATIKVTGGSFAGDGDVLAANGVTNGTVVNGGNTITVSYNSSTETLTLTGVDTLADYQFLLDRVTFRAGENPTDFGSNPTRSITWVVQDPSGTANGGSDTSSPIATTTVTITNVDDAPTLAVTSANSTWTEEQTSPSTVSVITGATASDPDNLNLASATVSISGGSFFTGDTLTFSTAGTSITGNYNSNTGVLVFSGSDSFTNYDTVLQSVQYNGGENPTDFGSDAHRTLTWTVNDGTLASAAVTATLSVVNVDDPPTLALTSANSTWTEEGTSVAVISGATATDPDNLNLASATVSISGGFFTGDTLSFSTAGTSISGSYNSSTGVLVFSNSDSLAHYDTVLQSVKFNGGENPTDFGSDTHRTLSWTVSDGTLASAAVSATLSVVNVDDAPTLAVTSANSTWTEEQTSPSTVSVITGATASDPDNLNLASATVSISGGSFFTGDTLSFTNNNNITGSYNSNTGVLVFSGVDSFADYDTALQSVQFNGGENPTDFGSDTHRTLSWTVNDGTLASAAVTATLSVVNVNDPPTLAGVASAVGATPTQTVTLSPSVTITDADDVKLKSATVTVTGGSFTGDGDVLAATTTGTNITATFSNTTSGEFLVLSGTDTLADYQSVLDSITWHSTAGDPTNGGSNTTRTLSWTVQDINGGTDTSTPQTETLTIDQPPTLSGVAPNAHWTEEGSPTTLSNLITISDPDGVNTQLSATVSITGGTFAGDHDVLAATTTGTNITASYNSSTETLTLTGSDSLANYQTVLDSVTFNAGENPTNFTSNPTRTITWVVTDHLGTPSAPQSTTVSITNVNDPPTLALQTTVASWTEEPGTAITLSPTVTVTDPDNVKLVGATVQITGGTFSGDADVLAATALGNITVNYNSSTETLTLTGSDTLADYQTALQGVTFHAGENPTDFGSNPTRTITWVLNDGVASNNLSTVQTSTVSITNINDAPTLANVATTANYTEEGAAATLSGSVSVSDPDDTNLSSATVKITGGTFAGDGDVLAATTTGTSITASYNSSTETLTLSGADTLAHYQQVLDTVTFSAGENPTNFGSNPTRTVTWTLVDPSGTANGGVSVSTPVTSTISIANVNDAPTLSNVATSASFTQGGGLVTLSGAASVSDPDNLKLLSATVAITGGTFASDGDVLAATAVGTITVSYNAATETLTLTGSDTLAHYQQVLDTVTFNNGSTNPTNFGSNPTRTVVWTLNDGSASNSSSTPITETISLTGINAPPTLSNVATSANYTEEGAAATLSGSVSVSDPDDTKLSSATVKITGGTFAGDADLLAASTTGTSITASYNTSTETLTLSGTDTLAHYQQVLDSVTFAAGENPNDFGSNPTRTVTWTLMDPSGTAIGGSNVSTPVTSTISITNVNDPPTLSNVAANVRFLPHHTVTLSPALGVSDPDNLALTNATVSVTGGTFAGDGDVLAANVAGTSITASYNSSTETLTLTGSDSLAHYQQVLDSVAFSSGNNPSNGANNRTRTVSWVVNDGSASSNLSAPATTTITIGGPPVYDFNGDGDSDLLFQQASGTPQIWLMNGTSIISETSLATPPASWKIVTSGDFNGDGLSDILWINTSTNQPAIWEMNGTSIISAVGLAAPPSSWHIAGVGDVNGDGHSDIIWQNSDGTPSVWQMNGTSIVSATALPNPGSAWKIVATGDFNGDGNTDLLWDNTASGQPAIWEMNGSSIVSAVGLAPQPANMEIIGTGDFNGDGDADILWLNTITNAPTIWIMNGTSVTSMATLSAPPPSWRLVGTSDLYGTGKADILWQNSDGTTSVWQMNGTSIVSAIAVGTPSNPGGGWQLNNNDPPLPSTADATGGNGTTRLSMPDAANAGGGIPSYVAGAAGAGAGPTPALFSSNTTVANSLHVGSG